MSDDEQVSKKRLIVNQKKIAVKFSFDRYGLELMGVSVQEIMTEFWNRCSKEKRDFHFRVLFWSPVLVGVVARYFREFNQLQEMQPPR